MNITDDTQFIFNISYLIGLIVFIWKVASDHAKMKNDIKANKLDIEDNKQTNVLEHNKLESKLEKIDNVNIELQIDVAKIQTSIVSIEKGIIEIKDMIKERAV